jgi:hypothetical protein
MNPYSPPADLPPYPVAAPPYPVATGAGAGVSEATILALRQTRPWVMFLSILAFIGSAFMLLAGLFMIGAGLVASSSGGVEKGAPAFLGAIYLPLAILYIYPGIKMWMYGSAIGRLLNSGAVSDLEAALGQQKSFWKFSGIAAIVLIGLYILIFVGVIALGVATGLGKM